MLYFYPDVISGGNGLSYNSEKLGFRHRELLDNKLREIPIHLSEYSFANLYLFRESHNYEVLRMDDIFISGVTYDGMRYIMPTSDVRDADAGLIQELVEEFGSIFPVPEEWLSAFDPDIYTMTYNDGDTDYIYTLDTMREYAGKKLHNKRNLLYQFQRLYLHEALPLTQERIEDARTVLEAWQEESGTAAHETDYRPCSEALDFYAELELCGGIYYAEGEPAGFILGEDLSDNIFAFHFAKGKRKFKGLYQFMYNSFAKVMPEQFCCFNFEQDLGIESLRRAKSSYHPTGMLKKYRVSLK